VLIAMKADAGNIEVMVGGEFILRVDGGATVNNLLMQLQVRPGFPMHCDFLSMSDWILLIPWRCLYNDIL